MTGAILTSLVWTYDTWNSNFGIKHKFKKYLKESCWFSSDQHFLLNFLSKNAHVVKLLPK